MEVPGLVGGREAATAARLSELGSMEDMSSSSRTTSNMEGLFLVSSKEHLRAKAMNLLMHSEG